MFKKGERVHTPYGWGVVGELIENGPEYVQGFVVHHDDERVIRFNSEGAFIGNNTPRCVFYTQIEPPPEALKPPVKYEPFSFKDVIVVQNWTLSGRLSVYVVAEPSGEDKDFVLCFPLGEYPKKIDGAYCDKIKIPKGIIIEKLNKKEL